MALLDKYNSPEYQQRMRDINSRIMKKYQNNSISGNTPLSEISFKPKEKRGVFGAALDVLDAPDALFRSGLQYIAEGITGKDLYKTGDFGRIMQGKSGGSWSESLKRIGYDGFGGGLSGVALDIVTSPTTWLSLGLGAVTKSAKASKAIRDVGKLSHLSSVTKNINKSKSLAKEALKKSSSAISQTKKIKELEKAGKYVRTYDTLVAGAMIGKGLDAFSSANTPEERVRAGIVGGLGLLGLKGISNDRKSVRQLIEFADNPEKFVEKAKDFYVTGNLTNDLEKVYAAGDNKTQVLDSLGDMVLSYRPKGQKLNVNQMIAADPEFNKAFFDFADSGKINPDFKEYLTPEVKSNIELSQKMRFDDLKKRGKSAIESYISSNFVINKGDGWVEPTATDLLDIGSGSTGVKEMFDDVLKPNSQRKRKYANADLRDERLGELYEKGDIPYPIKTNRDFGKFFTEDINRAKKALANTARSEEALRLASTKPLDKLTGNEQMVRVYDSEEIKKAVDKFRYQQDKAIRSLRGLNKLQQTKVKNLSDSFKTTVDDLIDNDKISIKDLQSSIGTLSDSFVESLKDIASSGKKTKNITKKISNIREEFSKERVKIFEPIKKRLAFLEDNGYVFGQTNPEIKVAGRGLNQIAYRKDIATSFENLLSKGKTGDLLDNIDTFQRTLKLYKTQADLFPYLQGARRALSLHGFKKGITFIKNNHLDVVRESLYEADRYGLQIGRPEDLDVNILKTLKSDPKNFVEQVLNDVGDAAEKTKAGKLIQDFQNFINKNEHYAFNVWTASLKIQTYDDAVKKMMKQGASKEEAGFAAAQLANDMFAGQNWDMIMARNPWLSKETLRFARVITFAPDYLTSNLNKILKLSERSLAGDKYRKEALMATFFGFLTTQAINYAYNGHSTFENYEGNEMSVQIPNLKDQDGNPLAVNIMGNWGEPIKFMDNPKKYIGNKRSPLVSQYLNVQQGYGFDYDQLLPLPLSTQGLSSYALGKEGYGVPSSLLGALGQTGLEATGVMGTFRKDKKKKDSFITDLSNF